MAARADRRVYVLHRWMGLAAGLLLFVIGMTGVGVVFRDDLDAWQFRRMLRVEPTGTGIDLDGAFAAVRAARPTARLFGTELPRERHRALPFIVVEAGRYSAVVVDPYRAKVVGEYHQNDSIATVLLFLHYTLLFSPWGETAVALSGVVLFASGLTGLWVYRRSLVKPFRRGVRWRRGLRRFSKDLHLLAGVGAVLFNLLMAVTGFWMLLDVFTPEHYRLDRTATPPNAPVATSFTKAVATARAALPGFAPTGIYTPAAPGEPITVTGSVPDTPFWLGGSDGLGRSRVEIDAATGAVVHAVDIRKAAGAEQFDVAMGELHFGQYGGLPVKLLYAVLGLTPGILSITGFVLWLARRRRVTAAEPARIRTREA
ncbi:MAG TPA: PepSY-associated TM helix domain-containing protein [Thermoanaerobaculia bacterium]|nr:PepSY-associated TM helix domain-containing protein [Thermoanaerobaculia bacterium]